MITLEQLQHAFPSTKAANLALYVDALNTAMSESNINTKNRVAGFLAQCCHESGSFSLVVENLNYSADGLQKIFHKYFPDATIATEYARHAEKIANRVYASRMGNGDEASGDGWKFKGRGLIQLTGKNNYVACGAALQQDLVANPAYLETPIGAARSAGWYWSHHGLNEAADANDITKMTKLINGGTIGLEERTKLYESAKSVFV